MLRVVNRVKYRENGTLKLEAVSDEATSTLSTERGWIHARVAKDVLDVVTEHHFVEYFTARHADEAGGGGMAHRRTGRTKSSQSRARAMD